MNNTTIHINAIKKIALALEELNDRVVFVGGAVVSLYVNDPAADDVRPTKDVDIILEISSLGQLEELRQNLTGKGFIQSAEDDVRCRFRYDDIKVDVMATEEIDWAQANEWFKPGFKHLIAMSLEGVIIHILPLAYFLASKFSAFHNRGSGDPRTSHDFEDIIYILDNRNDLGEIILKSPNDVTHYLTSEFSDILGSSQLQEAVLGNLSHGTRKDRFDLIIGKLKGIVIRNF
jgi:hypothetical protein